MPKCERCGVNDATIQAFSEFNGQRQRHFLCQSCAAEIMGAQGGGSTGGTPIGNIFGQAGGRGPGGPGSTATAQRQAPASKTPALDQFGRDLTNEAREGRLDPTAGRAREVRRVITVLARRQKN